MDLKDAVLQKILNEASDCMEKDIISLMSHFRIDKKMAKKLLEEYENGGAIERRMGRVYIVNRRPFK